MGANLVGRSGGLPITKDERDAGRAARAARSQANLNAYKISLMGGVTEHAMETAVDVDDSRRRLADGDQNRSLLLAEFEETFVHTARKIQKSTFDELGL